MDKGNSEDSNFQLISLIEKLNEVLSIENASVDRIISRIDQTSLQELNRRLKQHLEETYLQKSRLQKIITELGGKPTYAKADLSRLVPPATIIMKKRSITTAESKKEDNIRDNSMSEEEELVRIKQDRTIEFNELGGYSRNKRIATEESIRESGGKLTLAILK